MSIGTYTDSGGYVRCEACDRPRCWSGCPHCGDDSTKLPVEADGTYARDTGWEYARDLHGDASNLCMATVATLLGVQLEGDKHILNNKCWKQLSDTAAIYNHDGNYRLMVKG